MELWSKALLFLQQDFSGKNNNKEILKMSSEKLSKHYTKLSWILDTKEYETKFNTLNLNTGENS